MKAIEALYEAQKIAFSPFTFQAVYSMLELGILETIYSSDNSLSVAEIAENTGVSEYGVTVLTEMGTVSGVLEVNDSNKLSLSKTGYFLLRDQMTRVNLYFTQDVCYNGLFYLKDAIVKGKPEGLKVFGEWPTIYRGLATLPEKVKKSWFEFDHFYSDNSFDKALEVIFRSHPKMIFDIGGNTGKWAIASTKYNPEVQVTIFDLPGQLAVSQKNIGQYPDIRDRVGYHEIDLLKPESEIPGGADVYWMSQFLDCFSEQEIESILLKIRQQMKDGATVYIMETFIDDQQFKAASFSLIATSLYFTAMANGNSKMYSSSVFKYIIEKAGFECIAEHRLHDNTFHTILELKKSN